MSNVLKEVAEEAVARARSARRHKDAMERDMKFVRAHLADLRIATGLGPKALEQRLENMLDRSEISRLTAGAVGTSRKGTDSNAAAA